MNIERILSRHIVTAPRSASAQAVACLMRDHHVGMVLVTEDPPSQYQAIGIITDRDLALRVSAEGRSPQQTCAGELLTAALYSISATCSVTEAILMMKERGVRRLAVLDEQNRLIGVISVDDVIDALAAEMDALRSIFRTERQQEALLTSDWPLQAAPWQMPAMTAQQAVA
jgi:CBS domain-containing protein